MLSLYLNLERVMNSNFDIYLSLLSSKNDPKAEIKAKVIPINWKRIDEKTYQYDNMEISSVGDIETGIPFEVRNMMIKRGYNTLYTSFDWEDVINFVETRGQTL